MSPQIRGEIALTLKAFLLLGLFLIWPLALALALPMLRGTGLTPPAVVVCWLCAWATLQISKEHCKVMLRGRKIILLRGSILVLLLLCGFILVAGLRGHSIRRYGTRFTVGETVRTGLVGVIGSAVVFAVSWIPSKWVQGDEDDVDD